MIVVADTSVLVNLCRVGQGDLFRSLFQEVVIPPEVASEFARLVSAVPRFGGLKLPEGLRQQTPKTMPASLRTATGLDPGEIAALALAVEIHADAVLIDERRAHQLALRLGLRTVGILGLLIQAKSAGIVPAVKPLLEALRRDAGFWVSESLKQQVLRLAGE